MSVIHYEGSGSGSGLADWRKSSCCCCQTWFDLSWCWWWQRAAVHPKTQMLLLNENQTDEQFFFSTPEPPPPLCWAGCFHSDYRADVPSLHHWWKQLFDSNRRCKFNQQIKQTFGTQATFCLAASQEEKEKMRRAAGKVSLRFLDVVTSFWCLMGKEVTCNTKPTRVGSTSAVWIQVGYNGF